jgi:glycosyltransferase involved in cell wall biosynthesis
MKLLLRSQPTKKSQQSKRPDDLPRRAATIPVSEVPRNYQPAPIRVGFVVHAMQVAGAEMLVQQTIHRLGKQIEPTVFCLDSVGALGEQLMREGIPIVNLQRKARRDYGVAWRMAREIRRREIKVVHAHQYSPFFYAALAKIATGNRFRLILTEHGRHYPDVVSPLRRGANRLILDHLADAVNACCQFSAAALTRLDGFRGNRIEVIENGIDLSRFRGLESQEEVRAKLGLEPERKYVAMVARFHAVKDHAMLLRAFHRVARERMEVDLLLAGDGPLREALETQAREAGIAARVRFLGIRRDVPTLLRAVDVFALTSVSEAASLTLMEAMAAGRPVVVTNVGGNPEIVRDEVDGLLVPRGDDAACARALSRLLGDRDLAKRMGQSGAHRIAQRYSLNNTISAYHHLYKKLVGRV